MCTNYNRFNRLQLWCYYFGYLEHYYQLSGYPYILDNLERFDTFHLQMVCCVFHRRQILYLHCCLQIWHYSEFSWALTTPKYILMVLIHISLASFLWGYRQTVQIQIRHRIMRCLIWIYTVCLQNVLLKYEKKTPLKFRSSYLYNG